MMDELTGEVSARVGDSARGEAARRSAAAAASRGGAPGLDRRWDPTPVEFVQRLHDAWVRWSVVEVGATAVPGARGVRCLQFSRQGCIRRVWDYPSDWRTLDDAALTALSWHR